MKFSTIYIVIIVYVFAASCKERGNVSNPKQIVPICCRIRSLSSNYEIDKIKSKNGYLYVNEKYADFNKKLCPVSISFEKKMKVETLELLSNNHNHTKYSLYVNGSYLGSYIDAKKIALNREVKFLRIIFSRTEEEILVRGWDKKFTYTMLKDTSFYTNSDKTVVLKMADKDISFQSPVKIRQPVKETSNLNDLYFVNKGVRLIIRDKNTNSLSDQTACFYNDSNFFIDFIKVNNNRKIEHHYFLSGKWKMVNKFRNKIKINLNARFEGRISKNSDYKVFNYNKNIIIDSLNIIRTHDFLNKIMIDLPEWVMVRVKDFKADFVVDLPYASKNNFTHTKLYDCNECYLLYATVKDLLKAQEKFKQLGFRLKMLDCYRPYHVQRKLFEAFPVPGYVADPVGGSVHNKGSAVDLTLVDNRGNELDMGTPFDDLSRKSHHSYTNFPDTILKNRRLLLNIMRKNNFTPISMEWWHYNHGDAKKYPKIDDAFPCQ